MLDLGKLRNPKILVHIQIAGIRLRGVGIGTEEIEGGFWAEFDVIAAQGFANRLFNEGDDIGLEYMSL